MTVTDTRHLSPQAQEQLRRRVLHAVLEKKLRKSAAAQVFHVSRSSIDAWIKALRQGGEAALRSGKRGRKPGIALTDMQARMVRRRIIDRCPDQLKLPFALWTRQAVVELIHRKFRRKLSVWTVGRYLRKWGFTPQRPVRRAYERDPEAILHWLDTEYPAIERRAKVEKALIHWGDEMGLRSDDPVGRTWGIRGQTPEVPATGQRFGCSMISTITNRGHLSFMVFTQRFTTRVFLRFLQRLIRQPQASRRKIFLIVDGHPVHGAGRVVRWVAAHSAKLELFFLPGYAPELNPDELLNHDTKEGAFTQRRPRDQKQMVQKVRTHLRSRQKTPQVIRNFFQEPHVRYASGP
jgi:transposase